MGKFNPTFKINLVKIFNKTFNSREKDVLREFLGNASFRQAYGRQVIDRIIERTSQQSVDRFGQAFAKYSKSYKESDTFKIYQKSEKVTLELTGEMLSSMRALDEAQSITIEMIGDNNKAKAHGHKYGIRTKSGRRVVRDFLGLPENELTQIMEQTMNAYAGDAFRLLDETFQGLSGVEAFGAVGVQSEFRAAMTMNQILMELERNLGDE